MRAIKLGIALLMISILSCLVGLTGLTSYRFDFKSEGKPGNENGAWLTDSGTFGFGPEGLFLDDSWVTAPLEFSGDFVVKAHFWFNADSKNPGNIKIGISNRPWREDPPQFARFFLLDIGTGTEVLWVEEGGTGRNLLHNKAFDFSMLDRSGWNEIMMQRFENQLSLFINGGLVYQFELKCCSSKYYSINMRFDTQNSQDPKKPAFGGIIGDVEIQYIKGVERLITFPK